MYEDRVESSVRVGSVRLRGLIRFEVRAMFSSARFLIVLPLNFPGSD
jgi:hypothetical protein